MREGLAEAGYLKHYKNFRIQDGKKDACVGRALASLNISSLSSIFYLFFEQEKRIFFISNMRGMGLEFILICIVS